MKKWSMCIFVVAVCLLLGTAQASISPLNGTFTLDTQSPMISFDHAPWVSPTGNQTSYMWPFATTDYTIGYSGSGGNYNLGEAQFSNGNINTSFDSTRTGDMGIRINNCSGQTITWDATIVTLNLTTGNIDIYLPEITLSSSGNIYFWVADNGATYYANTSKSIGFPTMSASQAISAGDTYLAAIPEPSALLLFTLGTLAIRLNRK